VENRDTLFSNKVGIAVGVAAVAFGIATRNVIIVLLGLGGFIVRLPMSRLQRVLYLAIYFSLVTVGLLIYAAAIDALGTKVYLAAGALGIFAIGGWGAYAYGKKYPEKDPDFRP
jgi:predicted membrane channel-forming protein YqfA (hemolysin III family)